MVKGMLVGFGVALLLDQGLRRRRERRSQVGAGTGPETERLGPLPAAGEASEVLLMAPRGEGSLADEELVARVRAMVDIPAGVEVSAVEGAVVLFGRVPRFAFAALLSRVARVPGVVDVEDRLTPVDDLGAGEQA